jgi:lysozyme
MGLNDSLKISKKGLDLISRWEGCILKPYKDIAGLRTIGIGHLIKPDENFPDGIEITMEKAYELLAEDVKKCENSIKVRIKVPLNQNQFDALVSFGFNCGTGVYIMSDACKALNQGKYDEVPEKLLSWSKARINGVLQVSKGLYNRRKSEGELFALPVEQPVEPEVQDHCHTQVQHEPQMVAWTKESLTTAQEKLAKLGLYKIKIDGLWGPSTEKGIKQFAEDKKINLGPNPKKEVPDTLLEALHKV